MASKLVIRVDGNASIGLGHLIRCVSLAQMIKDVFEIRFCLLKPDESVLQIVNQNNYHVCQLSSEDQFFESLTGDEVIILDGYNFDTVYQARIKANGNYLICIDDLHDKHFVADAIINHAPGVDRKYYDAERYTQFLLGPDYALLRPRFVAQAQSQSFNANGTDVFVNFGGVDNKNLTIQIAKAVLAVCSDRRLTIVTGSAYSFHSELAQLASAHPQRIRHFHNLPEEAMFEVIRQSGVAIVPASGILFEVVACRIPCVSGYYTQNQFDIYAGFKSRGAFYDAGKFDGHGLERAILMAVSLESHLQLEQQRHIIDGLSPFRYKSFFNGIKFSLLNNLS